MAATKTSQIRKNFCKRGHEFTDKNTMLRKHPLNDKNFIRECRECRNYRRKTYRSREGVQVGNGYDCPL